MTGNTSARERIEQTAQAIADAATAWHQGDDKLAEFMDTVRHELAAIVAAERESCAAECELLARPFAGSEGSRAAERCARVIRSREAWTPNAA